MNITALIVTYNRKTLLQECLQAVMNQSRPVDNIVIFDNSSSDGTALLFSEQPYCSDNRIIYKRLHKNYGGAGGFYAGLKFCSQISDWVWLMDDDTIPNSSALEELIKKGRECVSDFREVSFLASKVVGSKNEPMNVPSIDNSTSVNGYPNWYLDLEKGVVKIKSATFVSLLINVEAVRKVGLPIPWYFIWGDDVEYTSRLTKYYGNAFFVGASKVVHKRFNAKALSIWTEDNISRVNLFFYYVRNDLYNKQKYQGKVSVLKQIVSYEIGCLKSIFSKNSKYRFKRAYTVNKGILFYLLRRYDSSIQDEISFE